MPDSDPRFPEIEHLIPHRDRMRLIHRIIEAAGEGAVTLAVAGDDWPPAESGGISPLVIIELAAQTAAVAIGAKTLADDPEARPANGWLVGVKSARLPSEPIPVGASVETRATVRRSMDAYTEIEGTCTIDGRPAGSAVLQVIREPAEETN